MTTQLTDIRIDAFGSVRNVSIDRLERGLTGVYGSNGSGKTTVLQFLRGTFGDRSASFWNHSHTTPSGVVDVLAQNGRRQIAVNGKPGSGLLRSETIARLATVTAAEANDTELVEQLAANLGIELADHAIDLSKERAAHKAQLAERSKLVGPDGSVAQIEAELARIEDALEAARAEQQRTNDRLSSQAAALRAAFASTLRDVDATHADYQASQSDLTEWQTEAWRTRRLTSHVESYEVVEPATPATSTGTELKNALLEIAQLRCKASARRAEATAGGPLDLCGNQLAKPLQIADDIRGSLDRLRNAAGTVPAAGLASRVDDLIDSLTHQQRAVDWLEADRTRVLLDRCERDLERAALRTCSVCASGSTACNEHTCTTSTTQARTIEIEEPPADAELGRQLSGSQHAKFLAWQSALARHRQARRQWHQFDAEVARAAADARVNRLIAERDAAAEKLASARNALAALNESIAALEAILAEDHAPHGTLVEAGQYFRELTCEHYHGLQRGRNNRSDLRALTASGHSVGLSELSRGTQAQAALAMRLALLDELADQGDQPPLILDDVLVDSDRDRAAAGIKLLSRWSQHRQTLLMSCQRQLIDAMTAAQIPVRTLGSQSVSPEARRQSIVAQTSIKPSPSTVQMAVSRAVGDTAPANVFPITAAKTTIAASQSESAKAPKYWLDPDSMIVRVPSLSETEARRLNQIGIESVQHLALVELSEIESDLVELQINPNDFIRYQSEANLLCCISGLSARDAQLLAWAEISNATELATIDIETLRSRLSSLAHKKRTAHLKSATESFSSDRLNRWRSRARAARSARSLFTSRPQLRTAREARRDRRESTNNASTGNDRARTLSVVERRRALRRDDGANESGSRSRRGESSRNQRQSHTHNSRSGRQRRSTSVVTSAIRQQSQADATAGSKTETTAEWRHYLETGSPVVDAPSIGPKMAKRLAKLGIRTVSDLLNANPGTIASGLDDRRIKKKTIIDWQDQARLMCRIPMLRGHDAQVLVACDYRETEKIAAASPTSLFAIVGPFVATKEGERVLRSSKVPDLEEVTDWINWARHARALKAA